MRRSLALCVFALACVASTPLQAGTPDDSGTVAETPTDAPALPPDTRNGREIFENFRDGLADADCEADTSARWTRHFAHAPKQLTRPDHQLLPLFGYVVDQLREAHLPTEYALIPFVESGYKPGARSPAGPTGMWQMIRVTARNHRVPIRSNYDGRLSPVDSTRAAVRYLKTLHGMFAGDWRLAVMAYNAGEYRVLGALRRAGVKARDADARQLSGVPGITKAYVRKLDALSCLLVRAAEDEAWLQALDQPVPRLEAVAVPGDIDTIGQFARRTQQNTARLKRLNPAYANGRIRHVAGRSAWLLAAAIPESVSSVATTRADAATPSPNARRHTVARGESAWLIARRYGLRVRDLLTRNGLTASSVLQPGQQLQIDPALDPVPSGAE